MAKMITKKGEGRILLLPLTMAIFQVVGERVVSGSYDHLVKVWALASGECLRTLAGHQEPVLTVAFDDDKIISGAADKTIKVGW